MHIDSFLRPRQPKWFPDNTPAKVPPHCPERSHVGSEQGNPDRVTIDWPRLEPGRPGEVGGGRTASHDLGDRIPHSERMQYSSTAHGAGGDRRSDAAVPGRLA